MTPSDRSNLGLVGRFSEAAGTRELLGLEQRLTSLEVAVPENLHLELTLETLVADLEGVVAEMASRHAEEGMGA